MKKTAGECSLVIVTAPDVKTARKLARSALNARLVACANLVPKLESHYWWRGKIEKSTEMLILFKTQKRHLTALEKLILAEHPYDTPELLVLDIAAGTDRYLDWIGASTKAEANATFTMGKRKSRPQLP